MTFAQGETATTPPVALQAKETVFEEPKDSEAKERLEDLFEMLTTCRPNGTKSERKFIKRFILPLGVTTDKAGNLFKRIGTAPILWSAHTDSVHDRGGSQIIATDGDEIALAQVEHAANCLGADNAAGVWLLREMIKAEKEGLYIFHRGEESGGIGSEFIAKKTPLVVADMKAAIAFDRRGTTSIITHQRGGRKCSDKFGTKLGELLELDHKLDTGGTFTDTANYSDLIGECTNISVGFSREHTEFERLDVKYLFRLREAMLNLDLSKLEFDRKPGDIEAKTYTSYNNNLGGAYGGYGEYDDDWEYYKGSAVKGNKGTTWVKPEKKTPQTQKVFDLQSEEHEAARDLRDLETICKRYPEYVADYLEAYGVSTDELIEHIVQCTDFPLNK